MVRRKRRGDASAVPAHQSPHSHASLFFIQRCDDAAWAAARLRDDAKPSVDGTTVRGTESQWRVRGALALSNHRAGSLFLLRRRLSCCPTH